jgi:hypothetical protein
VAIYHLSVKTISRSSGRSATAAIAYRAGERVVDVRSGLIHDYTRRRGIESTEILLPDRAPDWARDRSQLWNAAEQAELRKNSTVAREFEVAIPVELDRDQRSSLVRDFARELVVRHGMAVDVAIHEPGRDGDNRNFHAHILCSTRRLTSEGFTEKTRELDDQRSGEVLHWRSRWAELSNAHLERSGSVERIDHRSLEAQRKGALERGDTSSALELDRRPTIHLGPNVVQMEKRGVATERGDESRSVLKTNALIINLAEARKRLEALRAEHDRSNRSRHDRSPDFIIGQPTSRSGAERAGAAVSGANLEQSGRVPPPFARGRLRNLSQLSVVRFSERGEVLLPRDVPGHMVNQGAQSDNALRRGSDELKLPGGIGLVDSAKVRDLVKAREGERLPQVAANDASPELIKNQWAAERSQHLGKVLARAEKAQVRATDQMKRQEVKLKSHDQAMPQAPGGAFAGFKQATYEQAVTKWRGIRVGLEKRFQQIKNRLGLIGDYMRQSGSHGVVSKAERLAEQKAARAKPELAKTFAQIVEQEKAVAIAQRREQIQQRLTGKPQEKAMDQQTIDHLKSVSDANREKAERAELKELEKAGRLAAIQSDFNAEQKVDLNQITKQQGDAIAKELNADNDKGDQTKAARKIELLDRFKEKASRDRDDNSRGR